MNDLFPSEFYLGQNYPNPFKKRTIIKFCVAYKSRIRLSVYNSAGEMIKQLVDEVKNPGTYEVEFCSVIGDRMLDPAMYIYRLEAGEYKSEKRMQII